MNKHLKVRYSFTILVLFVAFLGSNISFVSADAGEERTIYLSATEYDYPPFSVTDNGEADGFSVELLKAVAEEMGITVTFKIDQWTTLKEELKNGELDILPLVGYTVERDEVYDFTVPYIVMRGNIFVRVGDDTIQSKEDLFGKKVLVLDGDNSQEWAWSIGLETELTATTTYFEAFELLASGEYDAILAQGLVGEKLIGDHEFDNVEAVYTYLDDGMTRQKLNLEGYEQKFCFAVVEGDAELLSILNEGLLIVSQNGSYDELYQKWFPFLIEKEEVDAIDVLKYVMYVLVPILALLITAYFIATKKTIKRKTMDIVSEKELAQKYLHDFMEAGSIFENSITNAPLPIMIHNEDGDVLNLSKTWTKITGYQKDDIPTIFDWTEKAYGQNKDEVIDFIKKLYRLTTIQHDGEFVVTTKDGRKLTWDFNSGYIGNLPNGKAVAMSVATDVTERNKIEREVNYLSYHDQLTGLYNRRFFEEQIKRLDNPRNLPISIIMGDVNGLKLVNDAFGHQTGDKLLKAIGNIISDSIRGNDIATRWGGDEFTILLPNSETDAAKVLINRIQKKIKSSSFKYGNLSISFGVETKRDKEQNIYDVFSSAEELMYQNKLVEIDSIRGETINTIMNTLFEKSSEVKEHSMRVSEYSILIAENMGLSQTKVNDIKTIGLIHDIGKIVIDLHILDKPDKLTDEERKIIEQHPLSGSRMLNSSHEYSRLSAGVLHHHERIDGLGYPNGISGDQIPLESKIIAVADAYDAMTAERPYRLNPLTKDEAIAELQKHSGTQFDETVVDVFVNKVLLKNIK